MNTIKNFFKDETGLELSEYAVAAALIAIAVAGTFAALGDKIKEAFQGLTDAITPTGSGGGTTPPAGG